MQDDGSGAEHPDCSAAVERVQAHLDAEPRDGDWLEELAARAGALRATLVKHYELEEQGPLYNGIPQRHPRFTRKLSRLVEEHDEILRSLDAVVSGAGETAPEDTAEVELRAGVVLARIRRHEAEEIEIVLNARWDDLAPGT